MSRRSAAVVRLFLFALLAIARSQHNNNNKNNNNNSPCSERSSRVEQSMDDMYEYTMYVQHLNIQKTFLEPNQIPGDLSRNWTGLFFYV